MGMLDCGADLSAGNGTLVWSYANRNSFTYSCTCFYALLGALCLSRKCRAMAVGFNACWHLPPMQINTPYSTFNATKWLNAWGMGWAMPLVEIFDGLRCS